MVKTQFPVFLCLVVCILTKIQGSPVIITLDEEVKDKYTDNWDYRVKQSHVPILNNTGKVHNLPPIDFDSSRLLWELQKDKKSNLPMFFDKALKLLNLKQVAFEIENSVLSKVSCSACKAGAGLLQHYTRIGKSEKEIKKTIYQFCVNLKLQTPRVCEGITELFAGEVLYVLGRVPIGADEICSFVIGDACGDVYNPVHEWNVMFPPVPKPAVVEQKSAEVNAPSFKVLHLSDTHYDPYYMEGSNANCAEPLCCRFTNGLALSKKKQLENGAITESVILLK
ncbi:hypothetical protein WA026_015045 [Henosepilachna vigintioctopunctata]|uniref:Saposin B-type domain-containing protein n=1 Tax=Henosepilachna vigintioctopunctata TaxID=420089 RepID=A0AAW1TZ17_9CUCU